MNRRLRTGYTTGACAAAAAKAAASVLAGAAPAGQVEIPFPDGSRVSFAVHSCWPASDSGVFASVIKDAGDDPDVTHGAEITTLVTWELHAPPGAVQEKDILLAAGPGVGRVTRPGLAVAVGEPAINPVPRRMIHAALREALPQNEPTKIPLVTVGVTDGDQLAIRTLNRRLGIVDGLSILGSTGIVRPVSAEAWQATIVASLDVARAAGLKTVLLSTGRSSEAAVLANLGLSDEAGAMMGDHLAFSLQEAGKRGFTRIVVAGMWAKIVKAAMAIPQTHVRHGALDAAAAGLFIGEIAGDPTLGRRLARSNTAREILEILLNEGRLDLIRGVTRRARDFAAATSGRPVEVWLVAGNGKVLLHE